jgi:4'-phosphopantetheinyl transferase
MKPAIVGSPRGVQTQMVSELPVVSVAETLAGVLGIVDVWYWYYDETNVGLRAAHAALMTTEERDRYERFRFERDRQLFMATRVLVRTVLSRYASVASADWRFATGAHGKPYIADPPLTPPIHFNLANTSGLITCVVSVAHDAIGVDVERMQEHTEAMPLAERYFAASEVQALRALPAAEQPRCFVAYWTLKESYIKARGLGLTLPLDQFAFFVDDERIRVNFDPRLADDAIRWRFSIIDASPQHVLAVSVDTRGASLSLRAARIVPDGG